MLKRGVVDAVREGKFSIYPIEMVEEGLEILTGMSMGQLGEDGTYPEGTFNHLVMKRLTEISEALKEKKDEKEEPEKKEDSASQEKQKTTKTKKNRKTPQGINTRKR